MEARIEKIFVENQNKLWEYVNIIVNSDEDRLGDIPTEAVANLCTAECKCDIRDAVQIGIRIFEGKKQKYIEEQMNKELEIRKIMILKKIEREEEERKKKELELSEDNEDSEIAKVETEEAKKKEKLEKLDEQRMSTDPNSIREYIEKRLPSERTFYPSITELISNEKDRYILYTKKYTERSTLLHIAARYSNPAFIFLLVNVSGCHDIYGRRDYNDETALEIAALKRRDVGVVKMLLRAEAKRVNRTGETSLMRACRLLPLKPLQDDMSKIISELLCYETRMQDYEGKSALYYYFMGLENAKISSFVQESINQNYGYFSLENFHLEENDVKKPETSTAQDLVELVKLAETFDKQKKPVTNKQLSHSEILSFLVKNEHSLKDKHKRIALHFVAQMGLLEFVKILCKESLGDVRTRDDRGQTALMCAIREYGKIRYKPIADTKLLAKYIEIIKLLAKSEADVCDNVGITPLMLANSYGLNNSNAEVDRRIINILTENAGEMNSKTQIGKYASNIGKQLDLTNVYN